MRFILMVLPHIVIAECIILVALFGVIVCGRPILLILCNIDDVECLIVAVLFYIKCSSLFLSVVAVFRIDVVQCVLSSTMKNKLPGHFTPSCLI